MANTLHSKQLAGKTAYHAGLAAEISVSRHYERAGYAICATRWRGTGGEIDLIVQSEHGFVFVEVKKSARHDLAALRVSPRQTARLFATALEFAATQPAGQLSDMRFDVALVSATGEIQVLENALQTG